MRLLVDGVFFQLNNTGIARVWQTVLSELAKDPNYDIFFLDRGGTKAIEGITYLPFPNYHSVYCPADSQLIQSICDTYQIDLFTTTYYTSPLRTPMVFMVYDMIPEIFKFDMSLRGWMEKDSAINFAQRYVCISENTRKDLLDIYPHIPPERACVAYCGVDTDNFYHRSEEEINGFKAHFELEKPYFLFVGTRVQHKGYKNSKLFFDALARLPEADFDVLCVGGEPSIEQSILDHLPQGVQCKRVSLTDNELSLAYSGAIALVYPSLYEGFGMPVIEAMASNCPVITTHHGSLAEAAGDAAHLISGHSVSEMLEALVKVRESDYRKMLKAKGLEHSQKFRWSTMVSVLSASFKETLEEARQGAFDAFFEHWEHLRDIQASVDY